MPRGCSAGFGGVGGGLLAGAFLAGAFLAAAFFAGAFFAGAFLAGAFAGFLTALAGGFFSGGVGAPSGGSCGSVMRPLLRSSLNAFSLARRIARVPSCQEARRGLGDRGSQGLRRTAHQPPAATRATAATANGHTGMPPPAAGAAAGGPGVPVPATASRNDQDPDTTWPSADVTR